MQDAVLIVELLHQAEVDHQDYLLPSFCQAEEQLYRSNGTSTGGTFRIKTEHPRSMRKTFFR